MCESDLVGRGLGPKALMGVMAEMACGEVAQVTGHVVP